MYKIKKCSEVSDSLIFKAFEDGFADYMIQMKMDEAFFIDRFFGPEGNDRALSFIAFKEGKPVGVTLGGMKTDENFKTLRCGGMAVIPEERGTGLAKTLMEHHEKIALEIGCRQLFLEVIDGNDRAISFYKKIGYEKVYNLTYRTLEWEGRNPFALEDGSVQNRVEPAFLMDIERLRKMDYSHLPWQGSFDYFMRLACHYYGIKDNGQMIAGIVATKNRVFYLWVHPEHRQKGYAKALISRAVTDLESEGLRITYANNSEVHTFANHCKMEIDPISQLEMYKWLG